MLSTIFRRWLRILDCVSWVLWRGNYFNSRLFRRLNYFRWRSWVFNKAVRLLAYKRILLLDRWLRNAYRRGLRYSHLLENIVWWQYEVTNVKDCSGLLFLLVGTRLFFCGFFNAGGLRSWCLVEALLIVNWLDLSLQPSIMFILICMFSMSRLRLTWLFLIISVSISILLVWVIMVMMIISIVTVSISISISITITILPLEIFSRHLLFLLRDLSFALITSWSIISLISLISLQKVKTVIRNKKKKVGRSRWLRKYALYLVVVVIMVMPTAAAMAAVVVMLVVVPVLWSRTATVVPFSTTVSLLWHYDALFSEGKFN